MKLVKQSMVAITVGLAVAIGLVLLADATNNKAEAAFGSAAVENPGRPQVAPNGAVVVLFAGVRFDLSPSDVVVTASSSSAGAPAVTVNADLAQALSELRARGFRIQHIESTSDGLSYTLVR